MALVLVALGFKIAAVPFQIWVPDVYQGAPTPVTAFLSVGSKAAGFVVLLRVLEPFFMLPQMQRLLVVLAALTLIYGNLAALPQTNLKRLLAYSSIAHAGYLLIGVVVVWRETAVVFYLVAYLLMTMLSFAVLIVVADQTGEHIEDFNGLAKRSPFLAFAMLMAMASLAGVPFTAGFLGKFFIFDAAIRQHQTTLLVVGVITVACGFYYYLKVVRAMYWEASTNTEPVAAQQLVSRNDDRADGRHYRPGRLPRADLECVATALGCARCSNALKRSSRGWRSAPRDLTSSLLITHEIG